ncbi:MAG: alkaline phosphatase family protein [Candidatus Planktophila sp.]|nr:alkaline phosphatase family protein [Candidatus Planktophila sp.]
MHLSQITPSIFSSLGLGTAEDSIDAGTSLMGREILFLVDGFGADVLETFASVIPNITQLKRHAIVDTAFPSTTATSLATLTTGTLPGVHGMLGYTVQVPRSGGRILNALKWDERVDPTNWQPVPTLFERAMAEGINVAHVAAKRYENSGFTRAVFRGAEYRGANVVPDLIAHTKDALRKTPSFVYLYMNELDVAGHSDGVGSKKWLAALAMIDLMVANLMKEMPKGTRIWLTSDHGMINVGERIVIGDENPLLENIATIAGEPRARHLYLRPNHDNAAARSDVASVWQEFLGDRVDIYTREQAIDNNLFGELVSADSLDRMGEVIAVAQGTVVLIDPTRIDKESSMVGHHGADSDIETQVALLTTTLN